MNKRFLLAATLIAALLAWAICQFDLIFQTPQ